MDCIFFRVFVGSTRSPCALIHKNPKEIAIQWPLIQILFFVFLFLWRFAAAVSGAILVSIPQSYALFATFRGMDAFHFREISKKWQPLS